MKFDDDPDAVLIRWVRSVVDRSTPEQRAELGRLAREHAPEVQAVLADVAANDPDPNAREAAAEQLAKLHASLGGSDA